MKAWQCYIVIPVLNESAAIGRVIADIPEIPDVENKVIVVDNGSLDGTDVKARTCGAHVLYEPQRGYGAACQKGVAYIRTKLVDPSRTILCILDGDFSGFPEDLPKLCMPIIKENKDFVLGARTLGEAAFDSLTFAQRWGNSLALYLIKRKYGYKYEDMGPFRAIHWPSFDKLNMIDKGYGWNVEMQIKALKFGLRIKEISVRYRKRLGKSKISGTVKGVIAAGFIILRSIYKFG